MRFLALVRGEPHCALRVTVVMGWFCCFRLFGCGFVVGLVGGVFVVVFALVVYRNLPIIQNSMRLDSVLPCSLVRIV